MTVTHVFAPFFPPVEYEEALKVGCYLHIYMSNDLYIPASLTTMLAL